MVKSIKYCKSCGKQLDDRAIICTSCGVPLRKRKDKLAAALLGLFLGIVSAEWFYLNKTGNGILSLLFCWTGIPSVVNFIHGVLLLISSDEEFDRKYNM